MYIELCYVASFLCPDLSRSRYFAVAGHHPRTNVNFRCLNRGNCCVYFREKLLLTNKSSRPIFCLSRCLVCGGVVLQGCKKNNLTRYKKYSNSTHAHQFCDDPQQEVSCKLFLIPVFYYYAVTMDTF